VTHVDSTGKTAVEYARKCIVSNQLAKKIEGRRRNEDEFAKLQSLIVHSAKKERRT